MKPVIVLAFANDKDDYLPMISRERKNIYKSLLTYHDNNYVQVHKEESTSVEDIFELFNRYRDRIAIFHYGGHAGGTHLQLETAAGEPQPAHAQGLARLMGQQKQLQLVFLNGCATLKQVELLLVSGVRAVIATSVPIEDKTAAEFAEQFYHALAGRASIQEAFDTAKAFITARYGPSKEINRYSYSDIHWEEKGEAEDKIPWGLYFDENKPEVLGWKLPTSDRDSIIDPLFGLPPIPKSIGYPKPPYRYLERYERKHARIFFGRSLEIRALYDKITNPGSPPVILLYGQSGVGKSSLLEAGLLPRLEGSHNVLYKRRSREKGLLGILEESIKSFSGVQGAVFQKSPLAAGGRINDLWKQIESQTGKPLAVLLDQAEEVFTDSNKDLPDELDDFAAALRAIFNNPESYPQGKLILGYRKEYNPEIEDKFKEKGFSDYTGLFLKPLNRGGIMEVVTGLTGNEALRERYNLKVEARLPGIIADNLLADKSTPVAPVLQIILTKMWETAEAEGSDVREFTIDKYQALRKNGLAMKDFFKVQMKELEKWNRDVVHSGLALDLLKFHSTEMGTAKFRGIEEIRKSYGNRRDVLEKLIEMEKNVYLLTDMLAPDKQPKTKGTSLAHDTLAPVVINEYNESDRPGQRAGRILAAKIGDFERNKDKVWLDEGDLEIVEQGKEGMKSLNDNEKKLLEVSRKHKLRRERVKKRNNTIGVSLIILIIIAAIFAVIQWKVAEERKRIAERKEKEANARRLAVIAGAVVKEEPTVALRLAEKACRLDKNQALNETIFRIYRENSFYKIVAKHKNEVYSVAFSPDGKYILTGSRDNTARLWDLKGNLIQKFIGFSGSMAFSPDGKTILTGSYGNTARLWDLQENAIQEFKGHTDNVDSVAFSPDGTTILTGSYDKTARLWNLQGNTVQEFKGHKSYVYSVAFSPDGKTILTGSGDDTARLWDLQGNTVQEFKGHKSYVYSVAFSPDGKTILTGSEDDTARLWDLRGKTVREFKGHKKWLSSVAFSPDGKTILTGSRDNTARLWQLFRMSLEDLLKKGHLEKLTEEQKREYGIED